MNNVIELVHDKSDNAVHGMCGELWLGAVPLAINARIDMPGSLTSAMRDFNLVNARSPGDWPMVHGAIEARVGHFAML